MKIVEDTPNRLVLKETALVAQIVAVVIIIVGLVVLGLGIKNQAVIGNNFLFDIIGIAFAALGVFLLSSAKSEVVIADKTSRQLSVNFKSLKNRQGTNKVYSFDDIKSVQIFQHYQQVMEAPNNFNNGPGMAFGGGFGVGMANTQTMLDQSLGLQLKNSKIVTIANEDKQTVLTLGISANPLLKKGQKLAAVIGVPFYQPGPGTPSQLFQGIERGIIGQPGKAKKLPR